MKKIWRLEGGSGGASRDEAKFSNSKPPYVFRIFFHLDLEEIFRNRDRGKKNITISIAETGMLKE